MLKQDLKFAVVGTGNSGQNYAADIALKGYSVNLAEVPLFADTLKAIKRKGGIELTGEAGNGFAKLNMMTTNLPKAIKGVDIIFVGGSSFAHEPFSKALAEHFEDGQFIVFTSNFAALRFRKWMKEADVTTDITPVETMSLLYATRAIEPGVVQCIGLKNELPCAALPASRTQAFIEKIDPVFPQFKEAADVWLTSVNNFNPIVHPPLILFNAGRIESSSGKSWNLYGDGATESVSKIMSDLDKDRMSILNVVSPEGGICFKDSFKVMYSDYENGIEKKTLSESLRKSPIHTNPDFPAPESLDTRYISEDLPFGLVPWSSIAQMWNIKTPTLDAVIQIASTMLEKDYFMEGITVKDLGIEKMSPDEVKQMLT
jgi:opine dehydrogenase|tara:strand:- start:2875 stop:3990 length:1116 start_codon:yes stop_codon:yes gene_type:complete